MRRTAHHPALLPTALALGLCLCARAAGAAEDEAVSGIRAIGELSMGFGTPERAGRDASGPRLRLGATATFPFARALDLTGGATFDYQDLGDSEWGEVADEHLGLDVGVRLHSWGKSARVFAAGAVGVVLGQRVFGDHADGLDYVDDEATATGTRMRGTAGLEFTLGRVDFLSLGVFGGVERTSLSFDRSIDLGREGDEDDSCFFVCKHDVGHDQWSESTVHPLFGFELAASL